MEIPDIRTIVTTLGVFLSLAGIVLCLRVATVKAATLQSGRLIRLGVVTLPILAFYKLLALAGLFAVPVATVGVANYHVFDGVKEVRACNTCHVMTPMVTDMHDPNSTTLAARHYNHKWIPKQQCFNCHADYGMSGSLEAKGDGYRHLARYTSGLYTEPIVFRGVFNNHNCLTCHASTEKFETVASHNTVRVRLEANRMSCLNCHGKAHPSREQRTPGHPDYLALMGKNEP